MLYNFDVFDVVVVVIINWWQWAIFLEYRGIPYGQVIEDSAEALAAVRSMALERGVTVSAIVNYEQMMLIRRLAGYKELEGAR
jgi:hypothetical protein